MDDLNNENEDFEEIEELIDDSSINQNEQIYQEPPTINKTNKRKSVSPKEKINNVKDKTGNVVKNTGKATKATGKTVKATGKGLETGGKGVQSAGKGLQTAGKGLESASNAAGTALSAIPYIGTALGGVVKGAGTVAGKGTQALGKGTEVAGKGMEKAGEGLQKSGDGLTKAGNKMTDTGEKLKNSSNKTTIGLPKTSSNNSPKDRFDKLKKRANNIKKDIKAFFSTPTDFSSFVRKIKVWLILAGILFVSIFLFIMMMFSPILDVLEKINEKWDSVNLQVEKLDNMYYGFGYQSTKEAFYEEVNYLYDEYDEQLDLSLLMATLFYKERENYNSNFGSLPTTDDGIDGMDSSSLTTAVSTFLKSKWKDAFEDLDADGKNYTIGKIYRLRKLARNQMNTQIFGEPIPDETETVSFEDFLERSKNKLNDDVYQALQGLVGSVSSFACIAALRVNLWFGCLPALIKTIYNITEINDGNEIWSTTSFGNESEALLGLKNLIKEVLITAGEISTIKIEDGELKVDIFKYSQNLDNYKTYLHDYYIPNMPEFKDDIGGLSGDLKEEKINSIISSIYDYADEFDGIFGYNNRKSGDDFDEKCIGNVAETLINKLRLPVDGSNYNFEGINGYGIVNASLNNGINLTKTSAGIKEGDNVYSVYGGKVIEVQKKSNCKTSDDDTCDSRGNYVKIKHDSIKEDGNKYEIETLYSNLKDVKVKKNDLVKKGDVIGTAGQTGDATESGVHFELYDKESKSYLNTTNIFIPCSTGDELVGGSDKEKIWCYLTKTLGYGKGKAAGTMANLQHESGLVSYRLQGDYTTDYSTSKSYTNKVDKKVISKYDFANKGPNGGGYGLAQWTSPGRKNNLYSAIKKNKSTSIGDLASQLKFLKGEISNPGSWTKGYDTWNKAKDSINDAKNATEAMMVGFERPADQTSSAIAGRQSTSVSIYNEMKNKVCQSTNINLLSSSSAQQKISAYLSWMKKIADDNTHGYSQSSRTGPDYDCSSFVYYALQNTIPNFKKEYPYTTWTLDSNVLLQYGFKRYKYGEVKLQPGDIVGNRDHHVTTIFSITNGVQEIAAHSNYDGKTGDGSGNEINVDPFSNQNYTYIFRLEK